MTKVRAAIVKLLSGHDRPLAVDELIAAMEKMGLRPNKTTIYRELAFLIDAGLVMEVDLGEGKKRYESGTKGHHHHLVCLNCHIIEEVEMDPHLGEHEQAIAKQHKFQVVRHSLEFYGLCSRCQK